MQKNKIGPGSTKDGVCKRQGFLASVAMNSSFLECTDKLNESPFHAQAGFCFLLAAFPILKLMKQCYSKYEIIFVLIMWYK